MDFLIIAEVVSDMGVSLVLITSYLVYWTEIRQISQVTLQWHESCDSPINFERQ